MRKFKLGMVITALAFAGAACGGDESGNNTNGNQNGDDNIAPNGTTNGTTNGTPNNNVEPNVTPNNNVEPNVTPNNNVEPNVTPNNNVMPNGTPGPTVPTCADMPQPPRCTVAPADVTWGPATVLDTFFIEGTADDAICCFDYNGDQAIDNALGMTLAGLGVLADINSGITDSVASGSLAIVLEHEGLDAIDNDDDFNVNFFISEHDVPDFEATGFLADSNPVLIDPISFDMGSHPQAYLPMASATGGAVTAGPGSVAIAIELFSTPLNLVISQARTNANIDPAASAVDASGVALTGGQLGGVVLIRDIFNAVNGIASAPNCACLGLADGEALVDPDTATCSANANGQACTDAGETTCAAVADNCAALSLAVAFADVDTDGDGTFDAASIGASYTGVGATINGVAP